MTLEFGDSWGGSAKARVDGGFYQIIPLGFAGYQAKKSNGASWVWSGTVRPTADDAERDASEHYARTPA